MKTRACCLLSLVAALFGAGPAAVAAETFEPSWESLANYEFPEWFRDAKFGIWAHWGAQCEPEAGDWYARNMYREGTPHYRYHLDHYGHPSKVGFKDVIHEWKAENFDPEALLAFYKQSGARYFVALANHHDNFDNFNSKYQPWNSVAIGPKKDLIGMFAKAAEHIGLRFGVSVHASRAWSWYEPAQGADKEGPYSGIPYDGTLTKADGKGQWWEGLDPQDLYAQAHKPGKKLVWSWNPAEGSSVPEQAYMQKFYKRTIQLWDDYKPDLIYFDDTVAPFYEVDPNIGLKMAAHFYNTSIERHGRNEAVMNGKHLDEQQRKALVYDIERGKAQDILPEPWQTDTCIGHWHYDRQVYYNSQYKSAGVVVKMLADIVSKNGNLLLSIPLRGDGTIDEDERKIVAGIGDWMRVNGEAIYATRPWTVYGEGPSTLVSEEGRHGGQADVSSKPFTAEDIRFTRSKDGKTLYAIILAWPENGRATVTSLARGSGPENIATVSLLGHAGALDWSRDTVGLHVAFPKEKPCKDAFVIKVSL